MLLCGLVLLVPPALHGQPVVRIGTSVFVSHRAADTDMKVADGPCCGAYQSSRGGAFGAGIEASLTSNTFGPIKPRIVAGLSTFKAVDRWTEPGDLLPSIDPDGQVIVSSSEHRLRLEMQGISLLLGAGVESAGFSIMPVLRATYLVDASTLNSLHLISPENTVLDPSLIGPKEEFIDKGRGVYMQKLGMDNHMRLLLDVGLHIGYHVGFNLLSIPFDIELQAYGLAGLGSIHRDYTTRLSTELGLRTIVGVQL